MANEYEYVDEYLDILTVDSMTTKRGKPAVLVACKSGASETTVIVPVAELPCLIETLQCLYDDEAITPAKPDLLTRYMTEAAQHRKAVDGLREQVLRLEAALQAVADRAEWPWHALARSAMQGDMQ